MPTPTRSRGGFTLVELLIVMVLGALVIAAVVQMLVSNNQLFLGQREVLSNQNTLQATASPLVWELREASATAGDLYVIDSTSVTLRSHIGLGVVCAKDVGNARYGLTAMTGEYGAGSADSVSVYRTDTRVWNNVAVAAIGTGASLGSPTTCSYTGAPATTAAIRLTPAVAADTNGIAVGSPIMLFRKVQYGIIDESGKKWLKRKVGTADWETIAGPLATNGLKFTYYNAAGAVTATRTLVSAIQIVLLGQASGPSVKPDTIRLRVALRN